MKSLSGVALVALLAAPAAWAATVYRCPGPPVLYTDALTPQEAKEKNCRTVEGAPVTVMQMPKPKPAAATGAPKGGNNETARVDPSEQTKRDSEARRILEAELKTEEERLALLLKDYNNGEPERRGDERNYQKYLDRVASMKAAIARKEADIAAIKRELAKLPP
ncbi:MAG: hypothetical protein AB1430_24085 [Pseudomonadota bacterium]